MSRFHVRCRTCDARQVLPRHPEAYLRPRACWSCGRKAGDTGAREWNPWRVDQWMMRRDTRGAGCTCAGYAWGGVLSGAMHRRGSKRCWYRTDGSQRLPGDRDFYEEYCYEEVPGGVGLHPTD